MRKKNWKEISRLQNILIEKLTPYYIKKGNWIDEWYDTLTVKIAKLKK